MVYDGREAHDPRRDAAARRDDGGGLSQASGQSGPGLSLAGGGAAGDDGGAAEGGQSGQERARCSHGATGGGAGAHRAVIKAHDLLDVRTRARHPESNGIVERFNATVRRESEDYYGEHYLAAQRSVSRLIDEYNNIRLHAALGYLEPREVHFGTPNTDERPVARN